jgi:hypothetical protein
MTPTPAGRTARGSAANKHGKITRDVVLTAALEIIDREGGHVLNELQELIDNPDETDDLLRLGLHRLPIGEFPVLRSLAPVLAT